MSRSTATRALDRAAFVLLGAALLSAWAAWLHMRDLLRTYGVICGDAFAAAPHCAACYASAALLAMAAGCVLMSCATATGPNLRQAEAWARRRRATTD